MITIAIKLLNMKAFLVIVLVYGVAGYPEVPAAPYQPSGWRSQGKILNLPKPKPSYGPPPVVEVSPNKALNNTEPSKIELSSIEVPSNGHFFFVPNNAPLEVSFQRLVVPFTPYTSSRLYTLPIFAPRSTSYRPLLSRYVINW